MKKTLLMLALAAGIASFAQNAQAELITINIGLSGFPIGAINGGVPDGEFASVANFPISGFPLPVNTLFLDNFDGFRGLSGENGLLFATGTGFATPVNFSRGATIGSGSTYSPGSFSVFEHFNGGSVSDFGAGSYMGFRTAQNNYGWLEVTWTASLGQFQILSGAYESVADVGIRAGAGGPGPAAVPEPGTWAAAALLAGGAGFMRWRKRAKVA